MKSHVHILLFTVLLLLLSACSEEQEKTSSIFGEATIIGQVVDQNYQPISDVSILANSSTVLSNELGIFYLESAKTKDNTIFIKASHQEYHHGSRLHYSTEDADNYVTIMLTPLESSGSFNAAEGTSMTLANTTILDFPPSAIVDDSGNDYNGLVEVFTTSLNPNDSDFNDRMPGNLLGINAIEEEQFLVSYGMLSVELRGSSGQELNIKSGSTVSVNAPIPDDMSQNLESIPLWSFNEETGLWNQEGTARIEANRMIGNLSHFSWWNFDLPLPMVSVNFQVMIQTPKGPIPAAWMEGCISRELNTDGKQKVCGSMDADGKFMAIVPVDEKLILDIYGTCDDILYSTEVGPYKEDTEEPEILISPEEKFQTNILGNLLNCDGEPVQDGVLMINFSEGKKSITALVKNGVLSETILSCKEINSVYISAIDLDSKLVIYPRSIDLDNGDGIKNIGDLFACDQLIEHFTIQQHFEEETRSVQIFNLTHGYDANQNGRHTIANPTDTSDYTLQFKYFEFPDRFDNSYLFYWNDNEIIECDIQDIEIMQLGSIGEYILGTFSSDLCGSRDQATNFSVSGSFSVIRQE